MRRRRVLAIGGVAVGGGCVSLPTYGSDRTPSVAGDRVSGLDWDPHTADGGVTTVEGDRRLTFAVTGCETALARATLDSVTEFVEVAFEYRIVADAVPEDPVVRVVSEEGRRSMGGPEPRNYETRAGRYHDGAEASGRTTLVLGVEPSTNCDRATHDDTRFEVRNLRVGVR